MPQIGRDPAKSSRLLRSMGRLYMAYGQYDKAEKYIFTAYETVRDRDGLEGEKAICLIDIATLYSYQDRLAEAEAMFRRGLEAQKKALFPEHPYVAHTLRNLSAVYMKQGQLDKAADTLNQAFEIIITHHKPENRILTPFYIDQAVLLSEQGYWIEAEGIFLEMLERVTVNFGNKHLYTAEVQKGLADLYIHMGKYDQAEDLLDSALTIQKKIYGENHQLLVPSYLLMAQICHARHQDQQMQQYFQQAVDTVSESGNIIAIARLYERIKQIRQADVIVASAERTVPDDNAG